MARYVVTGGGGFVGRALVNHLSSCGHEAIIASRGIHSSDMSNWIEYDLQRPETIANVVTQQADGVFHLAWSTVPGSADMAPGADIRTNVAGTQELFKELASVGTRAVFLSSGGTIYGDSDSQTISETHNLTPVGVYGMGKLVAEQYGELLKRADGFDLRIGRLSNPFGADHVDGKAQGAASIFARRILNDDPITIMGDGSVIRDYLDVDDAAVAIAALMDVEIGNQSPAFNIGSGSGVSLLELVHLLEKASNRKADLRFVKGRSFDVARNVLNIEKITKSTGWRPSLSILDGLEKLIEGLRVRNVS